MILGILSMVLLSMFLGIIRMWRGPTVFDRLVVLSNANAHILSLMMFLGCFYGNSAIYDIALVYALIGFIGLIGILRYFEPQLKHKGGLQ